jgi:hypothetical protein
MAEQQFLLFQKMVHKRTGIEMDLSFLLEGTWVETMDLAGPRLMMEFHDPQSYIKDRVGVRPLDEITVTLADPMTRDGLNIEQDYTVLTMPIAGDSVQFNCLFSPLFCLKNPAKSSRLYSRKPMSYIVRELLPGLKPDLARCPVVEDYHILAGERPTYMLRQMAREQGGHLFISREHVRFKRLKEQMAGEADATYHYGDPREKNQIIRHSVPSADLVMDDRLRRSFSGWNLTEGWVKSGKNSGAVPELHASPHKLTLDNLSLVHKPVLDFSCMGNGNLRAGAVLDLEWHMPRTDAPLDEYLPERVVAWNVAHYYKAQKYFCRVKGVQPYE